MANSLNGKFSRVALDHEKTFEGLSGLNRKLGRIVKTEGHGVGMVLVELRQDQIALIFRPFSINMGFKLRAKCPDNARDKDRFLGG